MTVTPLQTQLLLTAIPAAVIALLWLKPHFFAANEQPTAEVATASTHPSTLNASLKSFLIPIACFAAVVLGLVGFASGFSPWIVVASFASIAVAVLGAMRLGGHHGTATVMLSLGVIGVASGAMATIASDAIAICAGLGCAYLLTRVFAPTFMPIFLLAFALLDIVVVSSGLPQEAINVLSAGVGDWATDTPVFNHIAIGHLQLGAMDIAYAALIASVLVHHKASRFELLMVLATYTTFQALAVGYVTSNGGALPATLPGAVALIAFAAARWANTPELKTDDAF